MSGALDTLLKPQTRSFSALVGFFGHRSGGQGQETLTDVILDEANRGIKEKTFGTTAFRPAVGVNSSKAADTVTCIWYWFYRYRHEAPNGKVETDALRKALLERAAKHGFNDGAQGGVARTEVFGPAVAASEVRHILHRRADRFDEALLSAQIVLWV